MVAIFKNFVFQNLLDWLPDFIILPTYILKKSYKTYDPNIQFFFLFYEKI